MDVVSRSRQQFVEKDISMGIAHTIWVFDLASTSYLPGNQSQTLNGSISILNGWYLQPCTDPNINPACAGIDSATAVVAGGTSISPGPNDSVVFLVADVNHSEIVKAGGSNATAVNDPSSLGLTVSGLAVGTVSEVYWGRCVNDYEVAQACFHESAHLKSNNDPGMHTFSSGGGGSGVRALSVNGSTFARQGPNYDDVGFYSGHIPTTITLPTVVP